MQQVFATGDEVAADLGDLMRDDTSDLSSEPVRSNDVVLGGVNEQCDDDLLDDVNVPCDDGVLDDANKRRDADGSFYADVQRNDGAAGNTADAAEGAGNAASAATLRLRERSATLRPTASLSLPCMDSRRVRHHSVYTPDYDVNRMDQELCVHRELATRRGEAVEAGGLVAMCTVDADVNSLRKISLPIQRCSAVLDIGASKSVIGFPVARRLHAGAGHPLDLARSHRRFLFGYQVSNSIRTCSIDVPTPGGIWN
jgi:hypothetical protein